GIRQTASMNVRTNWECSIQSLDVLFRHNDHDDSDNPDIRLGTTARPSAAAAAPRPPADDADGFRLRRRQILVKFSQAAPGWRAIRRLSYRAPSAQAQRIGSPRASISPSAKEVWGSYGSHSP